jgi:tetratricopeptide (TPR) repeat protein
VIREAYERLGFMAPDSGVSKGESQEDPGAQLRAARMAWMNEQVETAWELLGQYEKKGSQVDLNEARLLRACLLFQLGNLDGASKCLEGSREGVSIEVLLGVAKVESRLRMFGEAAADFGAALEKGLASQDERRHVHRRMAELSYRQGKFAEAAHHAEMAEEKSSAGAGRAPEPVGILARVRLGQLEPANQQAGQMPSGPDAVVIREIMEVQNLVEALQRNGYVR